MPIGRKVLVVREPDERHEGSLNSLAATLRQQGYEVVEAERVPGADDALVSREGTMALFVSALQTQGAGRGPVWRPRRCPEVEGGGYPCCRPQGHDGGHSVNGYFGMLNMVLIMPGICAACGDPTDDPGHLCWPCRNGRK